MMVFNFTILVHFVFHSDVDIMGTSSAKKPQVLAKIFSSPVRTVPATRRGSLKQPKSYSLKRPSSWRISWKIPSPKVFLGILSKAWRREAWVGVMVIGCTSRQFSAVSFRLTLKNYVGQVIYWVLTTVYTSAHLPGFRNPKDRLHVSPKRPYRSTVLYLVRT